MPDAIAEVLIDPKWRAGNVTIDGNKLIYLTLCKPASLGVQAEVRALEARLRRHGLFGRPLFFDVLADDADQL